MRKINSSTLFYVTASLIMFGFFIMKNTYAGNQVKTKNGILEGTTGTNSAIRIFKGIPYAAPPVNELRWREPQPVKNWDGVRKAIEFGNRAMQKQLYGDMIFRDGMSEDCLYLNVWTPAKSDNERLPVMVWIYGGGFITGSTSERRQDGENLAGKGVVVVSMNYRLGVFGFLSHPDLTKESGRNSSGNYGFLDQLAALKWVHENISAFGGDPGNVTIFGESAGSMSVSALMASPLAKGLINRAIGESGSFLGFQVKPLKESEENGKNFASSLGVNSIEELRKIPADKLLSAAPDNFGAIGPNVDGYFLPESVENIFTTGKQNKIPLLAGWNADEGKMSVVLSKEKTTAAGFTEKIKNTFGEKADPMLKLYPAGNDDQALRSAIDLAGDQFIAFGTWRWIETHLKTGNSKTYRYSFDQTPLPYPDYKVGNIPIVEFGARHAGEIEYVFGTFPLIGVPWKADHQQLSDLMETYWVNFAKSGNPNAPGLPVWPEYGSENKYQVMHFICGDSKSSEDIYRGRYIFLSENPEWQKPRK